MNDKSMLLSRRTFLQGTGIALALPWFETFAVGSPNKDETPKRFLSVYHPDGVGLSAYRLKQTLPGRIGAGSLVAANRILN